MKDSFYIKKYIAREYKVKVKETSLYLLVVLSDVPCTCIYVVVSFYNLFEFSLPFFCGMVMY